MFKNENGAILMTNISQHVPTKQTCLKMKELGYPQGNPFLKWAQHSYDFKLYEKDDFNAIEECPQCAAPLATEILEELPETIKHIINELPGEVYGQFRLRTMKSSPEGYWVSYEHSGRICKNICNKNLAEALAQLWIYLKENKLIGSANEKD